MKILQNIHKKLETILGQVTIEEERLVFYMYFLFFLLFFFFMGAIFEKYKPRLGHETGMAVIAGIIWSILFFFIHG
jgi:hypothetical protein